MIKARLHLIRNSYRSHDYCMSQSKQYKLKLPESHSSSLYLCLCEDITWNVSCLKSTEPLLGLSCSHYPKLFIY